MKHEVIPRGRRQSVNLSIDTEVVEAARGVGLNLSRVAEDALRTAIKVERDRRWADEHREQVDAFTAWFEEHGMPFEDLRVF